MISDLRIGCLSTSSWRGLWTRKQWIMAQLAERNDILYVDPQESATYRFRWRSRRKDFVQSPGLPKRIRIVKPWNVLPLGRHWRAFHFINSVLLYHQIRKFPALVPPDIWWLYDPIMIAVVERSPAQLLIYDCVDRHAAYGGYRGLVDTMEARLLKAADIVFATARGLETHCRRYTDHVYFMPNGFDSNLYDGSGKIHPILSSIPRPIIGFVGGLGHWLDTDLIVRIARKCPQWSMVFIGPLGDKTRCFPGMPNIHLLGRFPREDMPLFINGFDVGIVPFRETELTRTVNPLKAYEYLACGIPVVSTNMPELDHLEEIRQASSDEGFISAVEEALNEGSEIALRKRRIESVAPFSQQKILRRMEGRIEEML